MDLKGSSQVLTGLVITKNEEKNIAACLHSMRWVDELIVVDAESTDATVTRARASADKVFIRPWSGFGHQKNFGIDQAKGPWVLIVDADERVTPELKQEIQMFLGTECQSDVVGYRIPRRNFYYGSWLQYGGNFPDYQLRLFKKEAGRYNDTLLHENLILKGDFKNLASCLEHQSIPTVTHHVRKMKLYTSLAAREKLRKISRVTYLNLFGRHLGTFVKTLIIRRGWKDGIPGLIAAMFAGLHTFVKYVKAYEILECQSSSLKSHYVADRI